LEASPHLGRAHVSIQYTLHPTLYTLHPTLYTLNPTLYTLHPRRRRRRRSTVSEPTVSKPSWRVGRVTRTIGSITSPRKGSRFNTVHSTPYTLHPKTYTLHPTPYTLHPTASPWSLFLPPLGVFSCLPLESFLASPWSLFLPLLGVFSCLPLKSFLASPWSLFLPPFL
jgi:hypothetical protein